MSDHHHHPQGSSHSQPGRQESTEALAYHIWEQAGRPEGQAARFWREAEEQIKRSPQPAEEALNLPHGRHGNAH